MKNAEQPTQEVVTLDHPIARGDKQIEQISVRTPNAGELRGVTLSDLLNLDVSALIKVIPRVSSPSLTEQEVSRLNPADLVQIGSKVAAFLLPKSVLAEVSPTE